MKMSPKAVFTAKRISFAAKRDSKGKSVWSARTSLPVHCLRALTVEAMDEWNATVSSDDNWGEVDTATVVSIGSSCVILISGCIAVVCLILYMKKSEQQMQRFRPHALSICAKCGATVALTPPTLESKRSVVTEAVVDDARRQSAPVERPTNESALYAISGANFEAKVGEDSLLGIICGHVSDTQTTTYSTNCNDIHSSSAQDSELIYELSRDRHCGQKLSFESFDVYESIGSERDTPTDPGIRQFTESPPKPNERRQGVVQHTNNESLEQNFGAIPRYRSRQPMWKLSSDSQTIKCLSSLTTTDFEVNGLSSDDSDDEVTLPNKSIDC